MMFGVWTLYLQLATLIRVHDLLAGRTYLLEFSSEYDVTSADASIAMPPIPGSRQSGGGNIYYLELNLFKGFFLLLVG